MPSTRVPNPRQVISPLVTPLLAILLMATSLAASPAQGSEAPILQPAVDWLTLRGGIVPLPAVDRPHRMRGGQMPDPVFADTGLWRRPPAPPADAGLRLGNAIWDRSSSAWFLPVAGMVVRLTAERETRRLFDGVHSLDVDLRTAAGLLVARTADDRIVLRRLGDKQGSDRTLLSGPGFFEPRFSPDGRRVLVSQSDAAGGRMWVVDLQGGKRNVGQGVGPVWLPDNSGLLFARVEGRSQRVRAAELWRISLADGRERQLTATRDIAEIEPAVSADGHWLAYADARTGDLCVARWPRQGR